MLGRKATASAVAGLVLVCLPARIAIGQVQSDSRLLWLNQANEVTDQIRKEAVSLGAPARAALFGQLAKLWRDQNRDRARSYMKRAIQEISSPPNRETSAEREGRLTAARTLMTLVGSMDTDFSEQLESILTIESREHPPEEANANASALVQAAIAILEKDPKRAAGLGSASLRVGKSLQLIYLLSALRKKDQSSADALFFDALSVAQASLDAERLTALSRLAFIGPAPSDRIRRSILNAIADVVLKLQNDPSDPLYCTLASLAPSLLPQFNTLLPERVEFIHTSVLRCNNAATSFSETATGTSFDAALKSVDDFLTAANETTDKRRRVFLLARAADLAAQEHNYVRAIFVLEQFTDEERQQLNGVWENWRWEYAAAAAVQSLKHDDLSSIDKILYGMPAKLRAFAEISITSDMASPQHKQKAVELLMDARQVFASGGFDISNDWYLSLLTHYVRFIPEDALPVLRDLVKAINRTDQRPSARDDQKTSDGNSRLEPIVLPTALVETQFGGLRSAIAETQVVPTRIRLTLGLVKSSLELAARKPSSATKRT